MNADIPSNISLHLEKLSLREGHLRKRPPSDTESGKIRLQELADIQSERDRLKRIQAEQDRVGSEWRRKEADQVADDRAATLKEGVKVVNKMVKRLNSMEALAQEYQGLAELSLSACGYNERLKSLDSSRVLKIYPLNQDRLSTLESLREELECIGEYWSRLADKSQQKEVKS